VTLTTLVLAAIFIGALTRATFGFGEAVVSMPLLALLPTGLHTAAALVGLGGLTVAVLSLAVGLRHVDRGAGVRSRGAVFKCAKRLGSQVSSGRS
jgi:uncharacterized membrane protein YfcA